jgi:hypothetical protein
MKCRLLGFLLALLTVATLSAQTSLSGDGRQAVEKSGIALVKPQKWSKPNEAVVMRFTAYTNRGGYFVLRTPSGQERQVWVEQIVGGVPLPNPEIPAEIITPAQRNALQDQVGRLKQLVIQVPSAKIDIEQFAKPLVEAIKRYDGGEVRNSGEWEPVATFRAREFSIAESQLRQAINQETEKAKFDLEQHSLFKQLLELSKGNAQLEAKIEALRTGLQNKVRDERQAQAIAALSNPNTSDADAAQLLTELKAIKDPDPRVTLILEQAVTAGLLQQEISKFQKEMEVYFAAMTPGETSPKLSVTLELQNQIISEQVAKFRSSAPPAAVRIPEENARALSEISTGLPKISSLFEQRNYSEAATVLSRLTPLAARIGPSTEAVFVSLKTAATKQVDLFTKLRTEAEVAQKEGNAKEAIAKYSAALEVSPNAELSAKIDQLKNPPKK